MGSGEWGAKAELSTQQRQDERCTIHVVLAIFERKISCRRSAKTRGEKHVAGSRSLSRRYREKRLV